MHSKRGQLGRPGSRRVAGTVGTAVVLPVCCSCQWQVLMLTWLRSALQLRVRKALSRLW